MSLTSPISGMSTAPTDTRRIPQASKLPQDPVSLYFEGHTHFHNGNPCTEHHHEDAATPSKKPNWLSRSFHAVADWLDRFYQQLKEDLTQLYQRVRGWFRKEKQPSNP